jgi:hypothetical protein
VFHNRLCLPSRTRKEAVFREHVGSTPSRWWFGSTNNTPSLAIIDHRANTGHSGALLCMSFDRVAGMALIDQVAEDRIHLAKPFPLGAAEESCST